VQWRIIVELSSTVGAKQVHEVHVGGNATPGCSAATLGLSLAEAKSVLAGLQRHFVQAQAERPFEKWGSLSLGVTTCRIRKTGETGCSGVS
jgi:hypothetical protein